MSKEKVKKKRRISGEAYDRKKQIIYTAPKLKIESRAHYAPGPERSIHARNYQSKSTPRRCKTDRISSVRWKLRVCGPMDNFPADKKPK